MTLFVSIALLVLTACNLVQPADVAPASPVVTRALTATPTSAATPTTTPTASSTGTATSTPAPADTPAPTFVLPPQPGNPYLGQDPPGMEPAIFAPGIVSNPDSTEYSGVFTLDGSEYYFYRIPEGAQAILMVAKVVDGSWSAPEPFTATAGYAAFEPYIGFDNARLYFAWDRPAPGGESVFPAYFFMERTLDGWSSPTFAGQGMFMSSDRSGQFYITDMSARSASGRTYLARLTLDDGVFTAYERLSIQPHFGHQAHPCIAPDGSYLLFDVRDGSYLYASFKQPDGAWGEAIDLTEHGFDPEAGGAAISPDGKVLFFALRRDIWWVDIQVIENLKPAE